MVDESEYRMPLLSLMLVLRDKGLLSEEDFKTIDSVSRLGNAVMGSGLVSKLDLEETGKDLANLLGYLSGRIRDGTFSTKVVQDTFKKMAGKKFPSLVDYITQPSPQKQGEQDE